MPAAFIPCVLSPQGFNVSLSSFSLSLLPIPASATFGLAITRTYFLPVRTALMLRPTSGNDRDIERRCPSAGTQNVFLSRPSLSFLCVRGILRKHSPCMNEKCEHEQDGRLRTAANADGGDTQGAKNGPSQVNDNIVLLATKSR